ncbi:MAG: SPOR domain-containing protein [Bacteroidetes bacterium]|nr:SPOR domain-containing protein [Bacteroidota bacterium]
MLRFFLTLTVLLSAAFSNVIAQEITPPKGKVEVVQDQKITQLEQQYKKMNLRNQVVDGYRIQIFFDSGSNSKKRATEAMDSFVSKYPTCRVFLSYKEPYYRVRVGNFRTLNEAVGFQKRIISDYPNAFPVKEKISFKELE